MMSVNTVLASDLIVASPPVVTLEPRSCKLQANKFECYEPTIKELQDFTLTISKSANQLKSSYRNVHKKGKEGGTHSNLIKWIKWVYLTEPSPTIRGIRGVAYFKNKDAKRIKSLIPLSNKKGKGI